MNSTKTLFDRIQSDPLIFFELAEYQGLPAIFDDAAPDDMAFGDGLVVVLAAPTRNEPDGTLTEQAWDVERDVRLYAKHTGSNARLDVLAEHVRDLFHLKAADLYVEGGTVTIATASGPVASPTSDPSLIGRRITVRLNLEEDPA